MAALARSQFSGAPEITTVAVAFSACFGVIFSSAFGALMSSLVSVAASTDFMVAPLGPIMMPTFLAGMVTEVLCSPPPAAAALAGALGWELLSCLLCCRPPPPPFLFLGFSTIHPSSSACGLGEDLIFPLAPFGLFSLPSDAGLLTVGAAATLDLGALASPPVALFAALDFFFFFFFFFLPPSSAEASTISGSGRSSGSGSGSDSDSGSDSASTSGFCAGAAAFSVLDFFFFFFFLEATTPLGSLGCGSERSATFSSGGGPVSLPPLPLDPIAKPRKSAIATRAAYTSAEPPCWRASMAARG
mmetsp:Transcript_10741/g.22516  ORF Transcript_10741/g.22516 Transcript_10741/m.22516 type:complete len:302 (+) Transcript_10741:652-1557(+)